MEYIPIIIGVLALLVAGFTFYKTSGLLERVRSLEKKNRELEAGLKGLERNRQSNQNQGRESNRPPKGSQQPAQAQPQRAAQPQQQEPRQKQQPQGRGQQEPRGNQGQPQQQRPPQEPRQKQEQQPPQQRQPREPRQPQEPRQKQGQPQQQQPPQAGGGNQQGQPREPRQPQQQRRNENRRREPMNPAEPNQTPPAQPVANPSLGTGLVGDDLLSELTTQPEAPVRQPEPPVSRTRYAIIPEDGIVKSHQLQQRPDSDSYLEIDAPEEGSAMTSYRFNLSGNQAFVISQGMDRLENAFSFEKPSNRMVNRIVQQGDGVLIRTSSGWKIQEKARIDFR